MKPRVVQVGHEVAIPFVLAYCKRHNLTADNLDEAHYIWWWAVVHSARVRAIMGLQLVADNTLFVWGFFGDGSGTPGEEKSLALLSKIIDRLPQELVGVIVTNNVKMARHARKHGWRFDKPAPNGDGDFWRRPALDEITKAVGKPSPRAYARLHA